MNAETQIKEKLLNILGLTNVDVINNSYLHEKHLSSPKNGNSHFKIIIKDKDLHELSRVQAHQKIYQCLSEEMKSYIHALEIQIISH
ncbi:MAG: BolA family transcriptional regulator [Candidatus Pelagibacter sp.]|nr:BolA family transcriptional regulator [Candidatus Pelagibacter sp.]OUV88553.1 MAG: BolA family transcriptional regulator [Pelagibacteraceae bacterium TMED136]|tara:strand:+ start:181 stop:441 length:261 start_codon:yes stop_codon:yes gene_type:complete